MKKVLLIISLINLGYVFITMLLDEMDNLFLVPFGVPLITTFLLVILGIVSLIFDENGTNKRTLSILIIGVNLLPILFVALLFIFI